MNRFNLSNALLSIAERQYLVKWKLVKHGKVMQQGTSNLYQSSWRQFVRETVGRKLEPSERVVVLAKVGDEHVSKIIQPCQT